MILISHLTTEDILKFTGNFLTEEKHSEFEKHILECDKCFESVLNIYRFKNKFYAIKDNNLLEKGKKFQFTKGENAEVPPFSRKAIRERFVLILNEEKENRYSELNDKELEDYETPDLSLLNGPEAGVESFIGKEEVEKFCEELKSLFLNSGMEIKEIKTIPGTYLTVYRLFSQNGNNLFKFYRKNRILSSRLDRIGTRIIENENEKCLEIEIPNKERPVLNLKKILKTPEFCAKNRKLLFAIGERAGSRFETDDLLNLPHLLVAGASGTGKSVFLNSMIASLLFSHHPKELKFVFIDSEKNEFDYYSGLKNHFLAAPEGSDDLIIRGENNARIVLESLNLEMEKRYEILAGRGFRNIHDYNQKYISRNIKEKIFTHYNRLPVIVVFINELLDITTNDKPDTLPGLLQMGRAAGIHVVAATRHPHPGKLNELVKANIPNRLSFKLPDETDSRNFLQSPDAKNLLEYGDLLYLSPQEQVPRRMQGAYISDEECRRVTDFISSQRGFSEPYLLPKYH